MSAQHTPWEAVDSLYVRGPFVHGDPEKPGLLIAQLPHTLDREVRIVHARLIAAAPELLAALEALATAYAGFLLSDYSTISNPRPDLTDSDLIGARAALAKATGSAA